MACQGCRGELSGRTCTDQPDIVVTAAGGAAGERVFFADDGVTPSIELPSGWRRTASGLTNVFFDVEPYLVRHGINLPAELSVLMAGLAFRTDCRCADDSAKFVEASATGDPPTLDGYGIVLMAERGVLLDLPTVQPYGVLWVNDSNVLAVRPHPTDPHFTIQAFATLDAGRVLPTEGDVVRAEFDGAGRLSAYVNGTLWGYTAGLDVPATGLNYAAIMTVDLQSPPHDEHPHPTYDDFKCGCL